MNTKLINFLIDDVRALIATIENNPELAAMVINTPDGEPLEDMAAFASYWSRHIDEIDANAPIGCKQRICLTPKI